MVTFPEHMVQFFQDAGQRLSLLSVPPLSPLVNRPSPPRQGEAQQYNKTPLLTGVGCWITPFLAPFHYEKIHLWLFLGSWNMANILFHLSLNTVLPQLIISSKESCQVILENINILSPRDITYLMQHVYGT